MKKNEKEKGNYTIMGIVNKAIEVFELPPPSEKDIDKYRQQIKATAKKYPRHGKKLYDQTEFCFNKETGEELELTNEEKKIKRNEITIKHYFTKDQMTELLFSTPLYDYFKVQSKSKKIRNSYSTKELENEAQERNRRDHQLLMENPFLSDVPDPPIASIEYSEKAITIMLEAIFQRYFEPLDTKMLFDDMDMVRNVSLGHHTIGSMQAEKRLQSGRNYYREKTESILEYVKKRINEDKTSVEDKEVSDYLKEKGKISFNSSMEKALPYIREYYMNKFKEYLSEYYKMM